MRKRILGPVMAVMLTATLGSAAPANDPPECVVAARWVQAHRGALPTTLAEMSRHPMLYRRAIYDVLPPAQRAALWREQLEGYLAPDQPYNEAQRAAIRDAIAQLPALTANNPNRAQADQVANRLYALFDRPTVRRMIGVLGPLPTPEARSANARRPLCDCESDYDCAGSGTCTYSLCSFTSGCGPFMGYICNGVCR